MLDASPIFHFAGTFGQEGSTWNIGTPPARSRDVCAAPVVPKSRCPSTPATMTDAIRTAQLRILRFMVSPLSLRDRNFRCETGFLFWTSAIHTIIYPHTRRLGPDFSSHSRRCGSPWYFGDCAWITAHSEETLPMPEVDNS